MKIIANHGDIATFTYGEYLFEQKRFFNQFRFYNGNRELIPVDDSFVSEAKYHNAKFIDTMGCRDEGELLEMRSLYRDCLGSGLEFYPLPKGLTPKEDKIIQRIWKPETLNYVGETETETSVKAKIAEEKENKKAKYAFKSTEKALDEILPILKREVEEFMEKMQRHSYFEDPIGVEKEARMLAVDAIAELLSRYSRRVSVKMAGKKIREKMFRLAAEIQKQQHNGKRYLDDRTLIAMRGK